MNIATIYTHETRFETILELVKKQFAKAKTEIENKEDFTILNIVYKNGLFSKSKAFRIAYRERLEFSYQLIEASCPMTEHLYGMLEFVQSMESRNKNIKDLLMQKIHTINTAFSIVDNNAGSELMPLIEQLMHTGDAIAFVAPNSIISKSDQQHFVDKNLKLILDPHGITGIQNLDIKINNQYFDKQQEAVSGDQILRKSNSIALLEQQGIAINQHLPPIASEAATTVRSVKDIAERMAALAIGNLLASNNITAEETKNFITTRNLGKLFTPKEQAFFNNPTQEAKNIESWKAEAIWVFAWSLGIIDQLGFPNQLCDLGNIPMDQYPISQLITVDEFISKSWNSRTKAEILDMNDLYYRYNWACTNARIKSQKITIINPSIVYERHYALNWLIQYMGQDWDDVKCNT